MLGDTSKYFTYRLLYNHGEIFVTANTLEEAKKITGDYYTKQLLQKNPQFQKVLNIRVRHKPYIPKPKRKWRGIQQLKYFEPF